MSSDQSLREHLVYLLNGGGAHLSFEQAFGDIPAELRSAKPPGLDYTPWRLLEHMRIAQWDILEFSRNADHKSPPWPEGYWPDGDGPESEGQWQASMAAFSRDLKDIIALIQDPATDIFAPLPWGDSQTILREALLVANHNAYHLGQMVAVRTLLGLDSTV